MHKKRQSLLTLLRLTVVASGSLAAGATTSYNNAAAYNTDGKWQKQPLTEELNEGSRLANARTSMLTVRVGDESVRGLAQVVKNHATSVAMCSSESESTREMQAMAAAFEKLNHRVGEILRTLDDAEQ